MADLSLPSEISPDGREVWAWADRLSKEVHRVARMRELSAQLAKTGKRCGDCNNWMKSSQCPRETNVRGMSRGPSCEAPICSQFVETRYATESRVRLTAELQALAQQPTQRAEGESA